MNADSASTGDRHSAYFDALRALDEALDLELGRVRAEQDAGRLTAVQAAAERVAVLERHLAETRRLRRDLGPGGYHPTAPDRDV